MNDKKKYLSFSYKQVVLLADIHNIKSHSALFYSNLYSTILSVHIHVLIIIKRCSITQAMSSLLKH